MFWKANFAHLYFHNHSKDLMKFSKDLLNLGFLHIYKILASNHAPFHPFIGLTSRGQNFFSTVFMNQKYRDTFL